MNKGSGFGPAMASTKGDGQSSTPHGKKLSGDSEGMASAIQNGSLSYNCNETVKGLGKGK